MSGIALLMGVPLAESVSQLDESGHRDWIENIFTEAIMIPIQQLSCWEIMQCGAEECVARKNPGTPCWEVVREMGYFQSTFNVCKDCIVFVSKQNPPILTARELDSILEHKAFYGLQPHCPAAETAKMSS